MGGFPGAFGADDISVKEKEKISTYYYKCAKTLLIVMVNAVRWGIGIWNGFGLREQ